MSARTCSWCKGPIPDGKRRDAETCSKRCRQARHRFTSGVGKAAATAVGDGHPRRLAYADPPYPGRSRRYYGDHPDYAGEVDHAELIASLTAEYDAWALSTAADSLQDVLALCPPGVRVAAWVKGARPHKDALGPLSSWEPVIYGGQILGRRAVAAAGDDDTSRRPGRHDASSGSLRRIDSLVYGARPRTTEPHRVIGAKPAAFCRWIFDLLDAQPYDDLVDIFPGSGGVARAWATYASGDTVALFDA